MRSYGNDSYEHRDFVDPQEPTAPTTLPDQKADNAEEVKLIKKAHETATTSPEVPKSERQKRTASAMKKWTQNEDETRCLIDEQLRKAGWEADTQELRYGKGTRPVKGRNLAIAEWPTDSRIARYGRADYALFIGLRLVGFVEAKATHKDVPSTLDIQAKEYARNVRKEDAQYQIGTWGRDNEFGVPFIFATNGRTYLEQWKEKSGIWFHDLCEPANIPHPLAGWPSPLGLEEKLTLKERNGQENLNNMPYDLLTAKNGLSLHEYQVQAIKAVENALANGQTKMLLAMATGTGKSRTALGIIYRLLKSERFRRVLFLVDRTSLGEQIQDVFMDVKLEDLLPLADIYDVKTLEDKKFEKETRIQVATVQGMVKRVLYGDDDEDSPTVTDYDLVIIDEAHRGYILDKGMSEEESLYRDQRDYQSKYRSIVDFFDGVKIALTATPALQTTQIFGPPVFQYTYRQAVIDGYLVDHDAPHFLKTKLNTSGITFAEGETVPIYNPVTGELTNSEALEDELSFDVDQFNRQVITEDFNRAVLAEIARNFDPSSPDTNGKMLIYAVNDSHADLIVRILREIYSDYGVDAESIMKITGSVGDGNKKRVQDAIKRFKNESYPSVAVTVDLLTTGIDVPEITTLVFLRQVRSRILFEQMLGRATRLCPKIGKTHFEIYDAVRLYENLEPVITMKPVVVNPNLSYTDMLDDLVKMDDPAHALNQINQILARLHRTKHRIKGEFLANFKSLADNLTPDEFINNVSLMKVKQAKDYLLSKRDLFKYLQGIHIPNSVVISNKPDELIDDERGFGENIQKPEDYLQAFTNFIQSKKDEIAALNVVLTKPSDLTRESLKSLILELGREGYTEKQLNTAIGQMTNKDMAADIISIIRRYALGTPLLTHEERIQSAMAKLRAAHNFTKMELNWLAIMEKYLLTESVINVQVFDEDRRFVERGGFKGINRIFNSQLESIVREINTYLYDEGLAA